MASTFGMTNLFGAPVSPGPASQSSPIHVAGGIGVLPRSLRWNAGDVWPCMPIEGLEAVLQQLASNLLRVQSVLAVLDR